MNISKIINILCIVIGGIVAMYAQAQEKQNIYLLMGGIIVLMLGVYRISRHIPSKADSIEDESYIKKEDDNEDRR